MVGVGPRRHVLAAVLDRGLVQPEMASRVTLGELDQLGDDPATSARSSDTSPGYAVIERLF